MFKRLAPALPIVLTLLLSALSQSPALAKHDDFLFGPPPEIKTWDSDQPGEGSIARAPIVRAQARALSALYMAPFVLGDVDGVSPAELKKRAGEALALIPVLKPLPKPPDWSAPVVKKKPVVLQKKKTFGADLISISLNDSLTFLRWRLSFYTRDTGSLQSEISEYLRDRNDEASKQGTILFGDLLALSLDYGRQGRELDRENLAQLAHAMTGLMAAKAATQADLDAVAKYELDVAKAYTLAQLDRRKESSQHFGSAIAFLRPRPVAQRPQTDGIRKSLLRVVDVTLEPYEREKSEVVVDKAELKTNINYLIDVAYLAKLDGRLVEAAYLFRRAYLLINRYLTDEMKDYTSLTYDLGETLMWDEKFDDSIYYLGLSAAARRAAAPHSVTAIDTNNLLGRSCLSGGQADRAKRIFFDNLRDLTQAPAHTLTDDEAMVSLGVKKYAESKEDGRRQIDDALQGVVDAALPLKQYDLALFAGESLLKIRAETTPVVEAKMMSVLWGLAYTCDSCAKPERAITYYTRMIDDYGKTTPTSLAYWYHGRGVDYDLIDRHDLAKKDINTAIALYREKHSVEEDDEARDHLYWTIADLEWNLKQAAKYPSKRPDYADLPENCRWRLKSFPLKVFVDTDRDRGFGGDLMDMVHEAVAVWTDYKDSPVKVVYVDKLSDADVFIERVTLYDDIPYGSAGRTSANYEKKGERDTQILTRTHIRVYCPSYDGNDWERQNVKMSSGARTQIKYLLVHEFGHVLGLSHSPSGPDIMYWKSCAQKLSTRDMNTINHIYKGQLQRVNLARP